MSTPVCPRCLRLLMPLRVRQTYDARLMSYFFHYFSFIDALPPLLSPTLFAVRIFTVR